MNEKIKAFLKMLEENDSEGRQLKKTYYRPSKSKCIFGFIFSVLFMIMLLFLFGFQFEVVFLLMFFVDLLLIAYYALNLFTEEGFLLPKYVEVDDKKDKYQFK